MPRYAILAINAFDYILNKTGNMLIRYRPEEVMGVIDPAKSGLTAEAVLGYGGNIPVVSSVNASLSFAPDTLVIGSAPQGGKINREYRQEIIVAINAGLDIISGMHQFLNDDPEFRSLAAEKGVRLTDLRRPPDPPHFPRGSWQNRQVPVLLVVGTDCDTGKMTTAWELTRRLQSKGVEARFVGTGQTGILLSGNGVPVDAVVADFMAGEIEYVIDQVVPEAELVVVEGQGSLLNMLYGGVTLGLLQGAMPDYLILSHDPERKLDVSNYPMPELRALMDLHVNLIAHFKPTRFLGVNLLTKALDEQTAMKTMQSLENKLELPVTDLVRFGNLGLIAAVFRAVRGSNKVQPGVT